MYYILLNIYIIILCINRKGKMQTQTFILITSWKRKMKMQKCLLITNWKGNKQKQIFIQITNRKGKMYKQIVLHLRPCIHTYCNYAFSVYMQNVFRIHTDKSVLNQVKFPLCPERFQKLTCLNSKLLFPISLLPFLLFSPPFLP